MLVGVFGSKNKFRWLGLAIGSLAGLYALLLIPEPQPPPISRAGKQSFFWSRDSLWKELEKQFRDARQLNQAERAARFEQSFQRWQQEQELIATTNLPPTWSGFEGVETAFFQLAVAAAVCPERNQDFLRAANRLATLAKWQSESWPADAAPTRERIYRLLYGRRAALEEVMLQSGTNYPPLEIVAAYDHPATPWAEVEGLRLHSGDILVSRGGAATSALIARGNDYRGNFSHVALAHVDEQTKNISVIESHIESGVGVRSFAEYLADTKLRIMVLRLRGDLPAVRANPQLPHQVATLARSAARGRHIPYDFAMDYQDPARQFCSEVVSSAYRSQGITLWSGLSQISAPGLTRWLTLLGVRNFASQQPSDLEYDPQMQIVAEWRNPETLFRDHVDNAVIDALLETAEQGAPLDYNRWLLPPIRIAKGWSVLLNLFGGVGPIPEGMSATTALRVERFKQRHAAIRDRVLMAAGEFQQTNGYLPPNWELLRLARAAIP